MCHGCVSRVCWNLELTIASARLTQPWHVREKAGPRGLETMTTVNTFFGPTANEVLAGYRRVKYASHTIETLAVRLEGLCASRDALRDQHGSEIEDRQSRVAETTEELEDARQQFDRIGRQHARLRRILDSFWGRMGIRLRWILSSDAPSLKETRQRLEGLERELKKFGDRVEYVTHVRTKRMRAFEHLAAPIEDLEFAINYLEREKETAEREATEQDAAINEAIHQTVRSMTPNVLKHKLPRLAGQLDDAELMRDVFRLRTVLARSQSLSHLCVEDTPDADIDSTGDTISIAITSGLESARGRRRGNMELSGQGNTRIKKTRTRMETTRDASGSPTTRARTETYWDRAKVTLSGSLAVDFDVEFCEWDADMTVEALRHEADTWFRHGLERLQESHMRETIESLNEEATALTSRIRSSLEDSTFASS